MSGVTIAIDEATPLLDRVQTAAAAQGLVLVGARAVAGLVKEHLYGLDGLRHKYGDHYFRQAGDSVTAAAVPQGAAVSITQIGFRLRLFGGTVLPGKNLSHVSGKPTVYLTIPAHPDAYGMRAGEFNDLDFKFVEDGGSLRPALVRRAQTQIKYSRRKGKDGTSTINVRKVAELQPEVMFWLVRKAVHQADPTVLPYAEQMSARAVNAIKTRMLRLAQRNAQRNSPPPTSAGDN